MAYTILYSDPAKNNNPIVVQDGTINISDTSLSLVGKNYPGYGQVIESNLVHILENFAAATPPSNPIEGQLWFDTSDPNNKRLKINDGGVTNSVWSPINGVFQQSFTPTNVKTGDIWVDTANLQLKFYNGTDFTLVGPSFSNKNATKTGSYPSVLTDTLGTLHDVVINYVDDTVIEITSADEFTPNPIIDGFDYITPGINVLRSIGNTSLVPKINGIADAAYNLQISIPATQKISADSFMRKDIDQSMGGTLTISNDESALNIGSVPTFILEKATSEAKFVNTYDSQTGGQFSFTTFKNGIPNKILTLDGDSQTVTIKNANTNLIGSLNVSNNGTFGSLNVVATSTITNAVQITGLVSINGKTSVSGDQTVQGSLIIGSGTLSTTTNISSKLIPTVDQTYNLGDNNRRWGTVYGKVFRAGQNEVARFEGIASSATSLASPVSLYIRGDGTASASFTGNSPQVYLDLTLLPPAFTSKEVTTSTTSTELLLVCSQNPQKVRQTTKRDFLKDINYRDQFNASYNVGFSTPAGSLVPLGTILPFAGPDVPAGWLLCDGSGIPTNPKYQPLRDLIGKTYDPSGQTYLLPNLLNQLNSGLVSIKYIIKY